MSIEFSSFILRLNNDDHNVDNDKDNDYDEVNDTVYDDSNYDDV